MHLQIAGREAPDPSAQRRTSRSPPVVRRDVLTRRRSGEHIRWMSMAGRLGFSRQKSTGRPYVCTIIDVGMTRRASGTDMKPPTAGSRTRPRAASRAPSVLIYALIEYQGGRVVEALFGMKENPHQPRRAPLALRDHSPLGLLNPHPTVSELQRTPMATAS